MVCLWHISFLSFPPCFLLTWKWQRTTANTRHGWDIFLDCSVFLWLFLSLPTPPLRLPYSPPHLSIRRATGNAKVLLPWFTFLPSMVKEEEAKVVLKYLCSIILLMYDIFDRIFPQLFFWDSQTHFMSGWMLCTLWFFCQQHHSHD